MRKQGQPAIAFPAGEFFNQGFGFSGTDGNRAFYKERKKKKQAQEKAKEEKAALAALNKEERLAKEQRVLDDMRALVAQQLETNQKS